MINVSNAFRMELFNDNRDYFEYADITLSGGGKTLNLVNEDLWGGGITIEDSVSKDNSLEIGSAIINKCTVVINNIYDKYSEYDFGGATVFVWVGLKMPDNTIERIRKGTFIVDEATYNGSIITLSCLDYMSKFDKKYSKSTLKYPATLNQIVRDACSVCGVSLQTYNFPHDSFVVQTRPNDEAVTFREIISWCAQIACCFCRCDTLGRLELKWYDQEVLEKSGLNGGVFDSLSQSRYTTGDTAYGGNFNPWDTGDVFDGGRFGDRNDAHYIYSLYSMDISVDDVVITGVRIVEKNKEEDKDVITTYQSGSDGYVISIENNELIKGGAGQTIAGWIGQQLIGFRFRKASFSHSSDPTIEAGDVGFLIDRKQNIYPIPITFTKFSTGSSQTTKASAQNPARNSAARFSAETKNYVDYRKDIEKERTDREKALEELGIRIDNSPGLFTTAVKQSNGSDIFYMHNKPNLSESDIVWKMTAEAWGVSTNGGKTYNAGMTVDGDTIVRILTAVGVNADWIKTGALKIQKGNKTMVNMDFDTGDVDMVVKSFSLTSGDTIDSIAKEEADKKCKTFTSTPVPPYHVGDIWMDSSTSDIMTCIKARSSGTFVSSDWEKRNKYIDQTAANSAASNAVKNQTQADIFNKLTNNGNAKGIFLKNGQLYISFTYAQGGELVLGGSNDTHGVLKLLDASGKMLALLDRTGGYIQSQDFKISDYYVDTGGTESGSVLSGCKLDIQNKAFYTPQITIERNHIDLNGYITIGRRKQDTIRGVYSFVQGNELSATDYASHAEGCLTTASNLAAHAEGYETIASGEESHAEGYNARAIGMDSHAEGNWTSATGNGSHAEGDQTIATGDNSHAEGYATRSRGAYSHAEGNGTAVSTAGGHVCGYYNSGSYLFTVGNGTQSNPRDAFYVTSAGNMVASGTKSRAVETENYGKRLQYCYETASPVFGDIGEGKTDGSGVCYIFFDDIFSETVSTEVEYQVFLQKEGQGDLWVDSKESAFFAVRGTPNLKFSWELKVKQKDYEYLRLENEEMDDEGIDEVARNAMAETMVLKGENEVDYEGESERMISMEQKKAIQSVEELESIISEYYLIQEEAMQSIDESDFY